MPDKNIKLSANCTQKDLACSGYDGGTGKCKDTGKACDCCNGNLVKLTTADWEDINSYVLPQQLLK